MSDGALVAFAPQRAHLRQVAYRMLASVSDAEDVVQDAYLRWGALTEAERAAVRSPRAYLTQVVTRLCLDRLGAARTRREVYPGTWLPEPLIEPPDPALADQLGLALQLTLERLSPLERAAFLLRDVFDLDVAEVAGALGRSEEAVRQLASRARAHVRAEAPRYAPDRAAVARLAAAFHAAMVGGDLAAIAGMLADDAVYYSDGGGKRAAARNPIIGKDRILRFFLGLAGKLGGPPPASTVTPAVIDGLPGFILRGPDGPETLALHIVDGTIRTFYGVRNPDKLRHLALG
ncbi:MAG: RNA polymerase sigma factor SigJ [Kofleriaceae bacterium]|nr:RNA polymerase sigma factor SigJ [Kofleriaceae bacterium]MBP6841054.1 RNA polymerase sigma factor SigJ [Kofleriaceae bacterium]